MARPDGLEKGQDAGRAGLGVKPIALVENVRKVLAVKRLIGFAMAAGDDCDRVETLLGDITPR
jgi:hypothetical protein